MGVLNRLVAILLIGLSCSALAACGGGSAFGGAPQQANRTQASQAAQPRQFSQQAYRLGGGDRLRVIVYGEDDLSGEFTVDGEGDISLPLIGQVRAGERTIRELESEIASALSEGYLLNPRVNVEVVNFRPFYIIGEVQSGGEYPYSQGMTVLNAVAVAGGYSYRADRRRVMITREGGTEEVEYILENSVNVLPGDVVRVPERFF